MIAKKGDYVVARRLATGERVKGTLDHVFQDGCALIVADGERHTVLTNTMFKPLAR